ncbi:2'-5' RNA ligase [Humidesulfovibrio mexicanus]|uniref:RNA 2',3'-cyclic phosphodiesterase n=1 Tax=Humidesulfovibrio mexicanus TaxID=147047 RepID=A0A238YA62_9BACT|nr:RNA 2',3'-cyclic phosphodiesterase [Humidesulfovibrio mexicanus]SNR67484.1 2'-5' RNA ligase [Humidesulfovibrio mexicanus]
MSGRNIRCFVALPLPETWMRGLDALSGALSRRLASRVSWTRPGNWHVTLRFLGEVEQGRVDAVRQALRAVRFAPFGARLGPGGSGVGGRGAPRVLWLGLAEGGGPCAELARSVEAALEPLGFAPEARAFRPHVTLGRVRRAEPGEDWGNAEGEIAVALSGALSAPGRVEEMALLSSVLGPGGPKYAVLEVYPARDHGGGPDGGQA